MAFPYLQKAHDLSQKLEELTPIAECSSDKEFVGLMTTKSLNDYIRSVNDCASHISKHLFYKNSADLNMCAKIISERMNQAIDTISLCKPPLFLEHCKNAVCISSLKKVVSLQEILTDSFAIQYDLLYGTILGSVCAAGSSGLLWEFLPSQLTARACGVAVGTALASKTILGHAATKTINAFKAVRGWF